LIKFELFSVFLAFLGRKLSPFWNPRSWNRIILCLCRWRNNRNRAKWRMVWWKNSQVLY